MDISQAPGAWRRWQNRPVLKGLRKGGQEWNPASRAGRSGFFLRLPATS